jgi:hypothetical protein
MKTTQYINDLIKKLAIISAFFPYNSFVLMTPTDIQPISVILILLSGSTLRLSMSSSIAIFLPLCLSFFYRDESTDFFLVFRSIFGYLSAFLIFNFFTYLEVKHKIFMLKVIKIAIFIYLVAGIINFFFVFTGQEEIFQSFLSIIKSRTFVADGGSRGVTGIVPEPSFMALTMYLLLLIYLLVARLKMSNQNESTYLVIFVISGCVLTYSGTTLFLAVSFIVAYGMAFKTKLISIGMKIIPLFSLCYLFAILMKILTFSNQGESGSSRFGEILDKIADTGLSSLLDDASILDRFWAVYCPFKSLFMGHLFGYGTSGYSIFMSSSNVSDDLIYNIAIQNNLWTWISTTRLMNSFGNYIIDFGWIGLALVLFFLFSIKIDKKVVFNELELFIYINTILICLQCIPVAHPLPWAVFGLLVNSHRNFSHDLDSALILKN